jgi:HK97 family phage portal protein
MIDAPAYARSSLGAWVRGLFGGLQAKASAVTQLVVEMVGAGKPVYTPRDFAALAREATEGNPYVYRAIMLIAQSMAGIKWNLYQLDHTGERTQIEGDHPLLRLLTRRVNSEQGVGEFWEQLVAYWLTAGNVYVEYEAAGDAAELWILRPDRMKVIPDAKNRVGGYVYTVGGKEHKFDTEEVLHIKDVSMLDDWYGVSPIAVAARTVDMLNASTDWNTALMQNLGAPRGVLVTATELGDKAYERLETAIGRKWTGKANAGRPPLLEGGVDWKRISLTPEEADWLKTRTHLGREIAMVLGVPPELLGDHENATYSNYQEARASFYTETVLPRMDRLRDALNRWLAVKFGEQLYIDYDRDDIEALAEDRAALWDRARDGWADGRLTLNEARKMVGLDEIPGELGKARIVQAGHTTLEAVLADAALGLMPPKQPVPPVAPTSPDGLPTNPNPDAPPPDPAVDPNADAPPGGQPPGNGPGKARPIPFARAPRPTTTGSPPRAASMSAR